MPARSCCAGSASAAAMTGLRLRDARQGQHPDVPDTESDVPHTGRVNELADMESGELHDPESEPTICVALACVMWMTSMPLPHWPLTRYSGEHEDPDGVSVVSAGPRLAPPLTNEPMSEA